MKLLLFARDGDEAHDSQPHHIHHNNVQIHFTLTATMFVHLLFLFVSCGFLMPYGFVCKQARARLYLAVQSVAALLLVIGCILGHFTGIEWYNPWFADLAVLYCLCIVAGSYVLLMDVPRGGILAHAKNAFQHSHVALSVVQPLFCFVTVGLSFVSLLQYCKADHLGQCLAHGIMGTAFIVYGIILLCMLYIGEGFLRRMNRSQEWYDSWVIMLWGIVNTFTEHRWNQPWNHGDVQHTSMGIIWWAIGLLGIYMSWDRVNDCPKRNLIPALVIIATGYSMVTHVQLFQVSTDVHLMFGVILLLAGLSRIVEICFVLNDGPHTGRNIRAWQYLTPLFLVVAGTAFMSATEEAMQLLNREHIMAAPYILIIASIGSLFFLDGLFMIQSYIKLRDSSPENKIEQSDGIEMRPFLNEEVTPAVQDFEISD